MTVTMTIFMKRILALQSSVKNCHMELQENPQDGCFVVNNRSRTDGRGFLYGFNFFLSKELLN